MFANYFYHENIRNTILAFATLFNNIYVRETDSSGNITKNNKVPVRYGPRSKFLARIDQAPDDLNNPVQITLPIMSFNFNGITYSENRKLVTTEYFTTVDPEDPTGCVKAFMSVPYDMSFELNIMSKLEKDCWQILEQIVPYFQPAYTVTIKFTDIKEKKDVPIQLDSIELQDDYEGNYESRRTLIYTLRFTVKTHMFGPIEKIGSNIITTSTLGFGAISTDHDPLSRELDVVYQATPTAVETYTNFVVGTLEKDLSLSDTVIFMSSVDDIEIGSILSINDESFQVTYISETNKTATVLRASFNTRSSAHVRGTDIQKVVPADNALIEPGDEFNVEGEFL